MSLTIIRRPNHFGKPRRNCLLIPGHAEDRRLRLSIVALVIFQLRALHREAAVGANREGLEGLAGRPILGFAAVIRNSTTKDTHALPCPCFSRCPPGWACGCHGAGTQPGTRADQGATLAVASSESLYYAVVKSNAACREWRMNRSTIARHVHPAVLVLIGLLCFCVTMQILGAPVSFWDMDMNETEDLVESSLEEECALPSLGIATSVSPHRSLYSPFPPLDQGILLAHSLFHPPLSHA